MADKSRDVPTPADFFNWMNQFAQPIIEATTNAANAAMPTNTPIADPLTFWKNMTQYNEKMWSEFLAKMVATPEFTAGMGRTASNQAVIRESVRKSAQVYLDAANMPSREDLTRVAAQIVALDAKVDNVEEKLLDFEPAQLASLHAKLDQLNNKLDHLAAFDARLTAFEKKLEALTQSNKEPASTNAKRKTSSKTLKAKDEA